MTSKSKRRSGEAGRPGLSATDAVPAEPAPNTKTKTLVALAAIFVIGAGLVWWKSGPGIWRSVTPEQHSSETRLSPDDGHASGNTGAGHQGADSGNAASALAAGAGGSAGPATERPGEAAAATSAGNVSRASARAALRSQSAQGGRAGGVANLTGAALFRQQAEDVLKRFFPTTPIDESTRESLIQALVNHQLEYNDILRLGREQGLSQAQVSKLTAESVNQFDQEIAGILGPDQGKGFIDVKTASTFFPLADDFAARCAAQGAPLTSAATSALAVELSKSFHDPSFLQSATPPTWLRDAQDAALKQAALLLTPSQLEIFKQYWSEHPAPKT